MTGATREAQPVTAAPRVITEPLGGSPLSLLAQRGEAPAEWYDPTPPNAEAWAVRIRDVTAKRGELDIFQGLAALGPALHATGAARERVDRVIRERGFVVTTGQQPGLFGGAGYTWTKALSAAALADALERASGVPSVAIFWAATDDADAAEASETGIAVVGGAERLVATPRAPAGKQPTPPPPAIVNTAPSQETSGGEVIAITTSKRGRSDMWRPQFSR